MTDQWVELCLLLIECSLPTHLAYFSALRVYRKYFVATFL